MGVTYGAPSKSCKVILANFRKRCWDLVKNNGWRRLPDIPLHMMAYVIYCQTPVVFELAVIFFSGLPAIVMFDLEEEVWAYTPTKYSGTWPYNGHLSNAAMAIRAS